MRPMILEGVDMSAINCVAINGSLIAMGGWIQTGNDKKAIIFMDGVFQATATGIIQETVALAFTPTLYSDSEEFWLTGLVKDLESKLFYFALSPGLSEGLPYYVVVWEYGIAYNAVDDTLAAGRTMVPFFHKSIDDKSMVLAYTVLSIQSDGSQSQLRLDMVGIDVDTQRVSGNTKTQTQTQTPNVISVLNNEKIGASQGENNAIILGGIAYNGSDIYISFSTAYSTSTELCIVRFTAQIGSTGILLNEAGDYKNCETYTTNPRYQKSIGPMAYFTHLVTLQYDHFKSLLSWEDQGELTFVAECKKDTYLRKKFLSTLVSMTLPLSAIALNETHNYFFIQKQNSDLTPTTWKAILQVLYKPNSDCSQAPDFLNMTYSRMFFDDYGFNMHDMLFAETLGTFILVGKSSKFFSTASFEDGITMGFIQFETANFDEAYIYNENHQNHFETERWPFPSTDVFSSNSETQTQPIPDQTQYQDKVIEIAASFSTITDDNCNNLKTIGTEIGSENSLFSLEFGTQTEITFAIAEMYEQDDICTASISCYATNLTLVGIRGHLDSETQFRSNSSHLIFLRPAIFPHHENGTLIACSNGVSKELSNPFNLTLTAFCQGKTIQIDSSYAHIWQQTWTGGSTSVPEETYAFSSGLVVNSNYAGCPDVLKYYEIRDDAGNVYSTTEWRSRIIIEEEVQTSASTTNTKYKAKLNNYQGVTATMNVFMSVSNSVLTDFQKVLTVSFAQAYSNPCIIVLNSIGVAIPETSSSDLYKIKSRATGFSYSSQQLALLFVANAPATCNLQFSIVENIQSLQLSIDSSQILTIGQSGLLEGINYEFKVQTTIEGAPWQVKIKFFFIDDQCGDYLKTYGTFQSVSMLNLKKQDITSGAIELTRTYLNGLFINNAAIIAQTPCFKEQQLILIEGIFSLQEVQNVAKTTSTSIFLDASMYTTLQNSFRATYTVKTFTEPEKAWSIEIKMNIDMSNCVITEDQTKLESSAIYQQKEVAEVQKYKLKGYTTSPAADGCSFNSVKVQTQSGVSFTVICNNCQEPEISFLLTSTFKTDITLLLATDGGAVTFITKPISIEVQAKYVAPHIAPYFLKNINRKVYEVKLDNKIDEKFQLPTLYITVPVNIQCQFSFSSICRVASGKLEFLVQEYIQKSYPVDVELDANIVIEETQTPFSKVTYAFKFKIISVINPPAEQPQTPVDESIAINDSAALPTPTPSKVSVALTQPPKNDNEQTPPQNQEGQNNTTPELTEEEVYQQVVELTEEEVYQQAVDDGAIIENDDGVFVYSSSTEVDAQPVESTPGVISSTETKPKVRGPPPRYNLPMVVVQYMNPKDKFTREEPTIRNVEVDNKGVLSFKFSTDIVWPESWDDKFYRDSGSKRRLRVRIKKKDDFVQIQLQNAFTGKSTSIPQDDLKLLLLDPKEFKVQVVFSNPELISMSSQSENDQLVIGFSKDLVLVDKKGRSVVLDLGEVNKDKIDFKIPIQPQVAKSAPSVRVFQQTTKQIESASKSMLITQFILNYIGGASMQYLWNLIQSQQNICYLPILSVQFPSQFNEYMGYIIQVVTFEALPMEQIYEEVPVFDFQWTAGASSRECLERIGLENRSFIYALGSMFVFMLLFAAQVIISKALRLLPCRPFTWIYKKVKLDATVRMVCFSFIYGTYIDLLISAFINTENEYLFDIPGNFGLDGNLNYSDQFTVLFGYFFYFLLLSFPMLVIILVRSHKRESFKSDMHFCRFEKAWGLLISRERTDVPFYMHYCFVFIMKRTIFAWIGFYLYEPQYLLLQIVLTIYLSLAFTIYLISYRPHVDETDNNLEIYNEISFLLIAYHLFMLTDYNPSAEQKINTGWSMTFLSFFNLIMPNMFLLLHALFKEVFSQLKRICLNIYNCRKNWLEQKHKKMKAKFERNRQLLITKYDMKLKDEFWVPPSIKDFEQEDLRDNQIIPILEQFEEPNIFVLRIAKNRDEPQDEQKDDSFRITHFRNWLEDWSRDRENMYRQEGDLTVIDSVGSFAENHDDLMKQLNDKKLMNQEVKKRLIGDMSQALWTQEKGLSTQRRKVKAQELKMRQLLLQKLASEMDYEWEEYGEEGSPLKFRNSIRVNDIGLESPSKFRNSIRVNDVGLESPLKLSMVKSAQIETEGSIEENLKAITVPNLNFQPSRHLLNWKKLAVLEELPDLEQANQENANKLWTKATNKLMDNLLTYYSKLEPDPPLKEFTYYGDDQTASQSQREIRKQKRQAEEDRLFQQFNQ